MHLEPCNFPSSTSTRTAYRCIPEFTYQVFHRYKNLDFALLLSLYCSTRIYSQGRGFTGRVPVADAYPQIPRYYGCFEPRVPGYSIHCDGTRVLDLFALDTPAMTTYHPLNHVSWAVFRTCLRYVCGHVHGALGTLAFAGLFADIVLLLQDCWTLRATVLELYCCPSVISP